MCIYWRRRTCTAFMVDYIPFLPFLDRVEDPESGKSGTAGLMFSSCAQWLCLCSDLSDNTIVCFPQALITCRMFGKRVKVNAM